SPPLPKDPEAGLTTPSWLTILLSIETESQFQQGDFSGSALVLPARMFPGSSGKAVGGAFHRMRDCSPAPRPLVLRSNLKGNTQKDLRSTQHASSIPWPRLHPDRTLGGDCSHLRLDRAAPAGGPGGTGGGTAHPVHQQPQAARPGAP